MKNKTLKTLKDLEGGIGNAEYFHREDIEPTNDYNKVVLVDELKQEAIKWVKDIRDSTPSTSQKKEDIRCFSESWIKHFFNITEEDLE